MRVCLRAGVRDQGMSTFSGCHFGTDLLCTVLAWVWVWTWTWTGAAGTGVGTGDVGGDS